MSAIAHWALARKEDYVRTPADVTNHARFAEHVFVEADGSFISLAEVLSDAHTRLWQLVSSGDGPHDGDELVLQTVTKLDAKRTLTLYHTLFFEEVHDFDLRNVTAVPTDNQAVREVEG